MILYKILRCENFQEINDQILAWIDTHPEIQDSRNFWNPIDAKEFMKYNNKFLEWNKKSELMISNIAVTVGRQPGCCGIHTDTPPARYKLSWPIKNTKNTWNRWFRALSDPTTKVNELGGVSYLNEQDVAEIDRIEVVQPMIIDAGIPHDVYIDEDACYPRLGLQCQLFKEPTSL